MFRARNAAKEWSLLVVAVLILYWRPALGQGFFFQRDVFLYWIPQIEWAVRSLATGRLPQWEASLGFGMPFLSDPSFQAFYPITWLNLILQPATVFTLMVVGHTLLGGFGAFRLLRRRLRSRPAALTGAITFVAAGALVSSANLWHHYASAMYMPWVADAFLRARRGRGHWIRLAVFAALQALAGSADVVLMTAFGLLFLLPRRPSRLMRLAPGLVAAAALCFGLAAAQWIPSIRGIAGTERGSLSAYDRLYWSVPAVALVDFVLPLTGVAHARDDQPDALEHRFRLMTSMYLGASTLPLLLLGARLFPRGLVLLLLSLAAAMGKHGPLSWASDLPVISIVRFPSKALWLFSLCWAVLVAVGLAALARRPDRFRIAPAAIGALLLLLAAGLVIGGASPTATPSTPEWQAIWRSLSWAPAALGFSLIASSLPRGAPVAMTLVIAVDLIGAGHDLHRYSGGEMMRLRPAAVDALQEVDAHRIFVLPSSRREPRSWRAPSTWSDEEAYVFGQGQMLVPPQGVRWGLRGSFDGNAVGLAPRDYTVISKIVTDASAVDPRWLQFGGVTHVLQFSGKEEPFMEVVARVQTFHEQELLVLRVPSPRPPVYLASRVRAVNSSEEALRTLANPDFDLDEEILRVADAFVSGSTVHPPSVRGTPLRIEEQTDGRIAVRVALDVPRTLVVLESRSEGWSVRVNGQEAPLHPANLLFLSVDLGPGEHLVEFEYQTPGLVVGLVISLLAWLGLLIRSGVRQQRLARAD